MPADALPISEAFNNTLRPRASKSTPLPRNGVRTVVIDPGHGGKDPGGIGKNSREKDIALRVSLKLAAGIRSQYPDVNVLLTRDDDTFVTLSGRATFANRNRADLFISIHANIAPRNPEARGTETWVMGDNATAYNLEVAKRENSVIQLEDGDKSAYNFDPYSDVGHIRLQMSQDEAQHRSIKFAGLVENAFSDEGRRSRGVKQSGFAVLKLTTMPSVLVELGFMTNRREEGYLLSNKGQGELAAALLDAFGEYHTQMGGDRPLTSTQPAAVTPQTSGEAWRAEGVSETAIRYKKEETGAAPATAEALEQLEIRLQLAALGKPCDVAQRGWDRLPYPVIMLRDGALYKYQLRGFKNGVEARSTQADLKARGVDGLLVAYRGGERLLGRELKAALSAR